MREVTFSAQGHSRVKPRSSTNNMGGGERCAYCSWKYGHYLELSQKHTRTQMLDQVPTQPGKCRNVKSGRWGMTAPFVGGMVAGGHIMLVAEMRATSIMVLSAGLEDASRDGESQFGPTDQRQQTLQISRLHLVTVAVVNYI